MFEESLKGIGGDRNLADVRVVDQLVRRFIFYISTSLKEDRQESTKLIKEYITNYAGIIAGEDKTYHGNEQWRLGGAFYSLDTRVHIDVSQIPLTVWTEALATLVVDFWQIAIDQHEKGMPERQVQLLTDRLIWFWTAMIFGTVEELYPDGRLWQEGPVNEAELLKGGDLQKAHNSGYTRRDGTYVGPFDDRRHSAAFSWTPRKLKQSDEHKPYPEEETAYEGSFHMMVHPRKGEDGEDVIIMHPSTPTGVDSWADSDATAIATPGCDMPSTLNGIAFTEWEDAPKTLEEWASVDGQTDLDEGLIPEVEGKGTSTGIIIQEPDGRVWVSGPTNQYGGYIMTYPKGHVEEGISYQANAIKEVYEETGLQVEITGLLGDFERTTTVTRMYVGKRVSGNPANMGWESQFIALVPKDRLTELVEHPADQPVNGKIRGLL